MANQTFVIENAEILFRNFSGKEGPYNAKGDRNFVVIIPDSETAESMIKDGWNIKYLDGREEGDEPRPYISVSVGYGAYPPRIVMITDRARTNVDESMVDTLDWVNIKTADVMARAYEWTVNGKSGVKAYLKSLYITIEEDYLEKKYAIDPGE